MKLAFKFETVTNLLKCFFFFFCQIGFYKIQEDGNTLLLYKFVEGETSLALTSSQNL